jgi:hypothetical protein
MSDAESQKSLLPESWNIPTPLRNRLGVRPGRQRALTHEGHLLLVLHAPPGPHEEERRGHFFWRSAEGTWEVAPVGEAPEGLSSHLATYQTAIERLDRDEEAADTCQEYFDLIGRLTPLARSARNLYATLQKARDEVPDDRRLILARDQAYVLSRRAELLHDDAKFALEFAMARQAEAQAESSHQMAVAAHRLNVLVALFFPVATLMAIFGANLHHGLENWETDHAPWVLLVVTLMGLLLGSMLMWIVRRPSPRPQNPYLREAKRDNG